MQTKSYKVIFVYTFIHEGKEIDLLQSITNYSSQHIVKTMLQNRFTLFPFRIELDQR